MGIFNRAIPNIQTNNLNQVRVVPQEDYYVDDIFDPLFNAKVKAQLREKYGNPLLGTIGGYMEGIDNALMGQDERWGILGPGMGILSGFGRSMDKAGDFIIGGLTEGVKFATGQGFENPLRNIFVEDEDYSGTRLLAAMGNSMAGLAQAPKLNESDFKGIWNIPAMGAELMTDPGILGAGMMKAGKTISLKNQVAGQNVNSKLSDVGKLLNDYDNFMAKVSIDLTAPGLRSGAKSLLNKIHQALGHSSARGWANTVFNSKESPEARMQAQEHLQNDPNTRSLLEMADEVAAADDAIAQAEAAARTPNLNDAQTAGGINTAIPTAVQEEFEDLDDLFESRNIEMIKRALHITDPEYIAASNNLAKSDTDVLSNLKAILDEEDKIFAESEAALFNGFNNDPNIVSNLDVRHIDIARDILEDYSKLSEVVQRVRNMDSLELQRFGINPEYSNLSLFPDEFSTDESFYDITENEATQKAIYRLAGVSEPKRNWALNTPVTLSPSSFAGRSEESYRKGVQASHTLLSNAFTRAGFSLENYKTPDEISKLLNNRTFIKSFPDEEIREQIVSDLNKILFPKDLSAYEYIRTVDNLTQNIIKEVRTISNDASLLVERVDEIASATGKASAEILNSLKEEYTLIPWVSGQTGSLKGAARTEFLDDLNRLDFTFNLEKSTKAQKTLKHMYELSKRRDEAIRRITSKNPLPDPSSSIYENVRRAHLADLNAEFTPYEKGLLTRLDSLKLHNVENIPRALNTSKQYHKFWGNILKRYEAGAKGTPYVISQELAEASENIRRGVLDVMSRKNTAVNVPYNNFFRLNAKQFEDAAYFTKFVDEILPELAKHYEVKLKAEYFVPKNIPLHKALDKTMPYSTRTLAKRATDILDEFYTLFDDDIAFLLKHDVDPRTPVSKFTRYKNNSKLYDTLLRVQNNLGKVPPSPTFTKEIPKNYKAYNFILNKIFPIDYVQVAGKKRPRIIDYYTYSVWDKPFQLQLTEIPTKELTFNDGINILNANMSADYLPPIPVQPARAQVAAKAYSATVGVAKSKKVYKNAYPDRAFSIENSVVKTIQESSPQEAAEIIDNFPTYTEFVEAQLMEELGVPEYARRVGKPTEGNAPPEGSKTPPTPSTPPEDIITPPHFKDLRDLIHGAMAATSNASSGNKASLRTDYVRRILDDADLLMSKEGITPEDIATYKQAQVYLSGASIPKEEFIDTLASSGMVLTAYKPHIRNDRVLKAFTKNVAEINVAMKSNVLKVVQFKLPNGNSVVGAMWNADNSDILNVFKKNYKNLKSAKLVDVVRLPKGEISSSISEYLSSPKYRKMDEFFDRIRQQEGEYAKILGFTYDDARHVKNVRNMNPDTANYLANIVYEGLPVDDLDTISDKMIMELDAFKHLRGAWGTRKYDKRFLGQIEDFEMDGIRIFEDDASKIVRGSLGEGSFNNANFQLYIDLVYTDNFKLKNYASTPEDIEKIFNAKLADGSESGNMQNLVLAAPRFNTEGRIVGFTQYDKTTRGGLMTALNNPDTVLLPAHVFSPLDKVLRKDAKMSNKVYAFITRHITNPFKLGVLMNPGFLIGNANDAFLKQAAAMAHKYNTSVPEEVANVAAAVRDVYVLNNKFDDAYRRFLVHIQSEGFAIAPSNQISSMAATDPRIRKMLKNYVNGKLQKGAGQPFIGCSLSKEERGVVKLWLMLNSSQTAASFDKGLQDLDVLAKAKNASKYQIDKNPISRILMGKGEYVSDDFKTWGLLSNPLVRKIMDLSELTENTARAATILNDFRHKGLDADWFKDYFDTLEELKEAAKTNPKTAEFRENIKKQFSFDMSESLNTMHNANFDYERMTDFTDMVGTYVPFPTFFLKNLGYWLDVLVNHPQYIDHAITVQESLWGSRDTSEDKFAAEAKGRGAVPVNVGGQNLSNFFKGIFKPTPLQSMFGAFSLINNPVDDIYYRLHPLLSGGITAATQQGPLQPIAADLLSDEDIKYRPYSTDMYERNVTRDDPNFNSLEYAVHRLNPLERAMQSAIRLPDKLREGDVQLSDFSPSLFQPDFGEKYSK